MTSVVPHDVENMATEKSPLISKKKLTRRKFCCYYGLCTTVLLALSITLTSVFAALYFSSKVDTSSVVHVSKQSPPVDLDRVISLAPNTSVCTTAVCVELAAEILESIDESKSPCDDFYNFACGQWEQSHYLPPGIVRI